MGARRPKTILITGATAGIGRSTAIHLAQRGHLVFAAGRNERALESLRREAKTSGLSLTTVRLDVTDAASIERAKALIDAHTKGRGIDVLVNNAGYGLVAP